MSLLSVTFLPEIRFPRLVSPQLVPSATDIAGVVARSAEIAGSRGVSWMVLPTPTSSSTLESMGWIWRVAGGQRVARPGQGAGFVRTHRVRANAPECERTLK